MTIHLSRDFPHFLSDAAVYEIAQYMLAIFCRTVMGWSVVGHTNMPIETPGGTWLVAEGTGASINQGSPHEYAVAIPGGSHTVTSSDIGRVIVLRSTTYPRYNSGLFHIDSVNTGSNYVYVDYRSGEAPPVDTGLVWALYENEVNVPKNEGDNNAGGGQYETQGASATATRIILQTPGGWQVRMCREGPTDSATLACEMSVTVGSGGDSRGDFPAFGEHTHIAQFFNRISTDMQGLVTGAGQHAQTTNRFYIWGDTSTECVYLIWRRSSTSSTDGMLAFGMTENEELPLPSLLTQRLFSVGASVNTSSELRLFVNFGAVVSHDGLGGSAFGLSRRPVSCVFSQRVPLELNSSNYTSTTSGVPIFRATARDSSFSKKTELFSVDVLAGTWDNMAIDSGDPATAMECRRIGTAPILKIGRANIGNFQTTPDSQRSWIHMKNGIYMPWEGPKILP